MTVIWVAAGGFAGAVTRFIASSLFNGRGRSGFPLGTFLVNLSGSLILGFLIGAAARETWQLLLGAGFTGALTTFSTMHLEAVLLYLDRHGSVAMVYILSSYIAGPALAFIGLAAGRTLF